MPSFRLLPDKAERLWKLCRDSILNTLKEQAGQQIGLINLPVKPGKAKFVNLRRKTLLLSGIALTGLIIVLYAASSTILLLSLRKAEEHDVRQQVKDILVDFTQIQSEFSSRFSDWSAWDDTYTFIQNANNRYLKANLTPAVLANLKLNLVLYIDSSHRIVFGTGFDLKHHKNKPIPEAIRAYLKHDSRLLQHHSTNSHLTGILLLPESPMLITSQPIVTSQGQGPIRGTLILGRYLNSHEIENLTHIRYSSLSLYGLNSTKLPADIQAVRSSLTKKQSILVRPVNEQTIGGYTLLNDIYGKPALLMRVSIPREIYKQSQTSLQYLITFLVIVELVIGGIILPLLGRLLLFQHELREREERYRAVVAQASEGIFLIDAHTNYFLEVNIALQNLLGYSCEEFLKLTLENVVVLDSKSTSQNVQPITNTSYLTGEWQYCCKDGSLVDVEVSTNLISYEEKNAFCIVVRDITQRKQAEAALRESEKRLSWQASHDSLTGLANRRKFEQLVEQVINSANSAMQHALCYLDLDQFKIVNDTCGHVAGDALLRQVSSCFRIGLRKSDALARLGGDEFGILLYQCPLEQAAQIANMLRERIQQLRFTWQEKSFAITVSIGLVVININTQSLANVLSAADAACHVAKNKGRNRVHIYQPGDRELEQQRGEMQWVSRIPKALEENRFRLYYQRIVSLAATECKSEHWEVLLRLEEESGKIVSPMAFIPAAERYNLMHLIDRWVVSTLFAYLEQQYQRIGHYQPAPSQPSMYTVNLSGDSINDEQFINFVQAQFAKFQIPPSIICFEITETTAIINLTKAAQFISELKAVGCYFALDDFGSGMSSFAYLKNLPVDYLKIDGVFIKDIVQDAIASQMVEAISRIATVMKIQTIAEFVENDDILLKLKTLGVDYAQGYGIAQPCPLLEVRSKEQMASLDRDVS